MGPQLSLNTGTYSIHNDYLTLNQHVGTTEYRYEFQMFRNNALPDYKKECDFLDLYWAGFKLEPEDMSLIGRNQQRVVSDEGGQNQYM